MTPPRPARSSKRLIAAIAVSFAVAITGAFLAHTAFRGVSYYVALALIGGLMSVLLDLIRGGGYRRLFGVLTRRDGRSGTEPVGSGLVTRAVRVSVIMPAVDFADTTFHGVSQFVSVSVVLFVIMNAPGAKFRRLSGVLMRRAGRGGTEPAASGLATGPGWRVMRAAARLMPPAAGRRWLAEAASSLFEASPEQRPRVVRSYLLTAPRVIGESWAGHLTRRIRPR